MDIVENIFRLLQEQGKTQRQLADYLGINESAIANWKNGKIKSYNKRLDEIATFFNVSISDLLGVESEDLQNLLKDKSFCASALRVSAQQSETVFPTEIQKMYNDLSIRAKLEVQTFIVDKSEEEKGKKS